MTRNIAATDLKAKLSEILSDVERGETIAVTRHGKTIARILPEQAATNQLERDKARRAIEDMRRLRASLPKTGITMKDILQWRHEGHKY